MVKIMKNNFNSETYLMSFSFIERYVLLVITNVTLSPLAF